jgi:hypothetical protein
MPASILIPPHIQFIDGNGEPLVGGKVYTYETDMSTPRPSYVDYNESAQNTNPVILDASGRASIWIAGAYGIKVTDANDVLIYSANNVISYDTYDFSGLTATIADLNATDTSAIYTAADYTVQISDRGKTILVNCVTGARTITLPAITSVPNGYKIGVKKIDFGVNFVNIVGGQIDAWGNSGLFDYGDFVEVLNDGGQWRIIASLTRGSFFTTATSQTVDMLQHGRTWWLDLTSNSIAITLPEISALGDGFTIGFKTGYSFGVPPAYNNAIITCASDDNIDGNPSLLMVGNFEEYTLKANMTEGTWSIVSSHLNNSVAVGDVKYSYNGPQPGWLTLGLVQNITIGKTSSAAYWAWDAFRNLFLALYNCANSAANFIVTLPGGGGRTGNGLNDWNALATMKLQNLGGYTLGAAGSSPAMTARALGEQVGEETHQLTVYEMPSHNHPTNPSAFTPGNIGTYTGDDLVSDGATSYTGGNSWHNNMQPTTFLYLMMKF